MTDCPNGEVRDLLPELLHGLLSPAAQRTVESHVGDCAECQAELALLRTLNASMRRTPRIDAEHISASVVPYRTPVKRSWAGWRAAAAIILLAAGGTSVALLQRGDARRPDITAVGGSPGRTAPLAVVVSPAPEPARAAPVAMARELATGSSSIGDLDDDELTALLADLETVEVVPSADVDVGFAGELVVRAGTE